MLCSWSRAVGAGVVHLDRYWTAALPLAPGLSGPCSGVTVTATGGAALFAGASSCCCRSFSVSLACLRTPPPPAVASRKRRDLFFEGDLIARQLLRQAADLLRDECPDAEDEREGDRHDENDGGRIGQTDALEETYERRQHE